MVWIKLPVLLAAGICFHRSITPPNPPPPRSESSSYKDLWSQSWVAWGPGFTKALLWIVCLCEALTIYARNMEHSSPTAHQLLSYLSKRPIESTAIRITPSFISSMTLLIACVSIRILCYRALGRFFTFQLTIRPKHQLVKTGPYAWVRHPSYTAMIIGYVGSVLCAFGQGSWMRESGWLEIRTGKMFSLLYIIWYVHLAIGMIWRTGQEDKMLKDRFGTEWQAWSEKVRYKLVPCLY